MKKIVAMILLVLLIPSAYALFKTTEYTGLVIHGKTVEAVGKQFTFKYDFYSKRALVESDVSSYIVPELGCESKNNIEVCIGEIEFAYRNATTLFDMYESTVTIYTITSDIEITHEIGEDSLTQGELTRGTISFENKGDVSATNFHTSIPIPEQLAVVGSEKCIIKENHLVLDTTINPTNKIICRYDLKAISPGSFSLTANISYFNGVASVEEKSTVSGKVNNASIQLTKASEQQLYFNEESIVVFELKNINTADDILVSPFEITIPADLALSKIPDELTKNGNKLTWSDTLESKESINFTLSIIPKKTGSVQFKTLAKYQEKDLSKSSERIFEIPVGCMCPIIENALKETEKGALVTILLINPNQKEKFVSISAKYKSIDGTISGSKEAAFLDPNGYLLILEKIMDPTIIDVDVNYRSSANEFFSITKRVVVSDATDPKVAESAQNIEPKKQNDTMAPASETQAASNATSQTAPLDELKKPTDALQKAIEPAAQALNKTIPANFIFIGGALVGASFLIVTLIVLRKRRVQKVKGKTLSDIEDELERLESKKKK